MHALSDMLSKCTSDGIQPAKMRLACMTETPSLLTGQAAPSRMAQSLSHLHLKAALCRTVPTVTQFSHLHLHMVYYRVTFRRQPGGMNNCTISLRNTFCLHAEHKHQIYLPRTFTKTTLLTTYYPGIHIGTLVICFIARTEGWALCGSNDVLLQMYSICGKDILIISYIAIAIHG